jgi:hypothetical protein
MGSVTPLPGLSGDRLKRAISAFVRELFPNLDYYRPWVYSVVSWDESSQTGSLQPSASSPGMPPLAKCPIRFPGKFKLSPGQEVVIQFDNGDPTRYFISHLGVSGSTLPAKVTLDASTEVDIGPSASSVALASGFDTLTTVQAVGRVVRYGDQVQFLPPGPGVIALPAGSLPVSKVKA